MIDTYSFGRMVIDGKAHTTDLIIFPDGRVRGSWRRASGHRLCRSDIDDLLEARPRVVVAGTGAIGMMHAEKGLADELRKRGVELRVMNTGDAMALYNQLTGERGIGACFHLTC